MLEKFNCAYTDVLPLKDIIPHEKNRNKHSEDQVKRLAKIIKFQGQRHPIIISTLSGKIVAGHCRAMAIKKLGWGEAAVDYQDFIDEEQEYLFMQSDNAIAEWAEPDLAGINQDIQDLGPFDIELLGFENFVVDMSEKPEHKTDDHLSDKFEKFTITIECINELEQIDLVDEFKSRNLKFKTNAPNKDH